MTSRRPLRTGGAGNSASGSNNTNMNFRPGGPDKTRADAKGTRPTAAPSSVREILVLMVMHVCKKTIFFDTNLKVALYLGSLFLISLIGDFIPFPRSYFSRSDNLFNLYFVKIGWGWTLLFCIPFLIMTSYTLCCGDIRKTLQNHLPRICIATFFWFFWTKMFNIIETSYGRCMVKGFYTKSSCLRAGHLWSGFDISGHAFILMYSSLVLIEEARPIVRWESIKEYLRNELHDRSEQQSSGSNPLRNLSEDQIKNLKYNYDRFTPVIRTLFIGMTALQLLWDVMLVCTMLYYHRMIEKVISGIIAILTWYFTYRFWYPLKSVPPDAAGNGCFYYQRDNRDFVAYKRTSSIHMTNSPAASGSASGSSTNMRMASGGSGLARDAPSGSSSSLGNNGGGSTSAGSISGAPQQLPKFMGMPLYTSPRVAASHMPGSSSGSLSDRPSKTT